MSKNTIIQQKIIELIKAGYSYKQIAFFFECSPANISYIAKKVRENTPFRCEIDYTKYANHDMSVLSNRSKRILQLKIDGKSYKEIAELENVSVKTIYSTLHNAREKLDFFERNPNVSRIRAKKRNVSDYANFNLDCLSDFQRRIFLAKLGGATTQQIADNEKILPQHVSNALHTAFNKLDDSAQIYNGISNKMEYKIETQSQHISILYPKKSPAVLYSQMNSILLNNIVDFVRSFPSRPRGITKDVNTGKLCVITNYAVILYNDSFSHYSENNKRNIDYLREHCPTFKDRNVSHLFDEFNNHFFLHYNIYNAVSIEMNEVENDVMQIKKDFRSNPESKLYSNHGNVYEAFYDERFGIKYNKELMFDVAKCLGMNDVTCYFPISNDQPIILTSRIGVGMITPVEEELNRT